MAAPLWTASAAERVAKCPPSAALPRTEQPAGEHAEAGTVLHAFMQAAIERGRDAALAEAPEEMREVFASIDFDALPVPLSALAAEVAFAFDVLRGTGRELGRGLGRAYDVGSSEIAGTGDAVGVSADAVLVFDWKGGHGEVTRAAVNHQLRQLALSAARAYRRSTAIVEIVRIRDDGRLWRDRATLDAFDLDVIEGEIRATWQHVCEAGVIVSTGHAPTTSIGPHCRYCPGLRHCPGQTSLVRAVVDAVPEKPVSAEQLVAAYHKIKQAQRALGEVMSQIHAAAAQTPLDLGDGTVLGEIETYRREVVGEVAQRVIEALHGPDVARAACSVTVEATFSSIRSALRPVAPRGKLTALEKGLEAALAEAGGIVVKRSRRVEAHKPRKQIGPGSAVGPEEAGTPSDVPTREPVEPVPHAAEAAPAACGRQGYRFNHHPCTHPKGHADMCSWDGA